MSQLFMKKDYKYDFFIYTSYFYQIRNFKPYMIPISTAMRDPIWFKSSDDKEYYIDKRGVVNGLKYNPLIVQYNGIYSCPCGDRALAPPCACMKEYRSLLNTINRDAMMQAFQFCLNKFKQKLNLIEEPIIVLMVHEAPNNPCSERWALQDYFQCEELKYPIKDFYI